MAGRQVGGQGSGLQVLALGSFVALGLPDGMLGTAWPSMRASLGAPVAALGFVLLVATAGSMAVSAVVGSLIRRLGVAALLGGAGALAAFGAVGFALAPGLGAVLAVAGLFGVAAGMMDGGLNTAVGLAGRPRLLNLLHAAYGVGTAIGPLVVTVAIVSGSWRPAYLFLVAVDAAVAVAWLAGGRGGRRPSDFQTVDPGDPPGAGHPSEVWSRRRSSLVVATGMAVFFVYTGVEVAAGQWEASFCRGHLGMSASAAGLATFGYWGALTGMRAAWALLPRPVPPSSVVKWGSTVAVAASAAIWWQPDVAVALAGFVVLGAALAGVFPALVGLTPHRIGKRRAQHVIAWQVGAAAGGGSAISAAVGLLIGAGGFAVLGPSLTGLATVLVGGNALLKRVAPVHPAGG